MDPFGFDKRTDRRQVPALKPHPMVVGKDGAGLFPAGVADMDFTAPPPVLAAMQARLNHGIFGYETLPDGLIPALTKWQADRHGWSIDPGHILRAPNVLNSLAIAASLFTGPGDGIIIQPPVFFDFSDIIRENHRREIRNPLILRAGHYEMDFDGLEAVAADPSAKMLFLCNPHNPVGRVWRRDELQRVADICARHDIVVVSDEIHADITFAGHTFTPFATLDGPAAQRAITCLSPAKSFNIAACCSSFTIVPDPDQRAAFQAENSRLTVNKNNAFASVAMQAAYESGGTWLDAAITYIAGNLDLVRACFADLPRVDMIDPDGTFLVWLDLRGLGFAPDDLTAFLRQKAGWAVTRGIAFGEEGRGFARLNIATQRASLTAALDRFSTAVRALP